MNANELRDKTPDELRAELVTLKKEQFNLRFQKATGQAESTVRMKAARRARVRVQDVSQQRRGSASPEVLHAGTNNHGGDFALGCAVR